MDRITLLSFRASEHQSKSEDFARGHLKMLSKFGITNITTNNLHWMSSDLVYAISAIDNQGDVIGGIRIQLYDRVNLMPLQVAVKDEDSTVLSYFDTFNDKLVAEICALWIDRDYAQSGLGEILFHSGVVLAKQINVQVLSTICAEYTADMVESVGFKMITEFGEEGYFEYPSKAYQARILVNLDCAEWSAAKPKIRFELQTIERHIGKHRIIKPKARNFILNYDFKRTSIIAGLTGSD